MRVRRRYQDGGRTRDLLRMLEQRQGPAPSVSESMRPSSLRVSREAPVYTSKDDAMLGQSRAGMQTFFGEERKPFDAAEGQGIKPVYPLSELTPAGDAKSIGESVSERRYGEAAAMAAASLTPIPANAIKKAIRAISPPKKIGPFVKKESPKKNILLQYNAIEDGEDFKVASLERNQFDANKYDISIDAANTEGSKYSQGKLIAEMFKAVPQGGVVDIESFSTDSYPYMLRYLGSDKADVLKIDFKGLNSTGENPQILARAFDIDADDVEQAFTPDIDDDLLDSIDEYLEDYADGTLEFRVKDDPELMKVYDDQLELIKKIKPKLDSNLKSLGLPETKLTSVTPEDYFFGDKPLILMPHPVFQKKTATGTYSTGGKFKPVKKDKYVKMS